MQYLRKAVEKKKQYLIELLKEKNIQESEQNLQSLTLSELEGLSKKYLSLK